MHSRQFSETSLLYLLLFFCWSSFTRALCPHELKWANLSGNEFRGGCLVRMKLAEVEKGSYFDDLVKICRDKFGPSAILGDSVTGLTGGEQVIAGGKMVQLLEKTASNASFTWTNYERPTFQGTRHTTTGSAIDESAMPLCLLHAGADTKYFPCSSPIPESYYANNTLYLCFVDVLSKCAATESACQCEEGYEGEFCQKVKGQCAEGICKNGGYCIPTPNSFKCVCPHGVTGVKCETDFQNECDGVDCNGRGTCRDLPNNFRCDCQEPYFGIMCEQLETSASAIGNARLAVSLLFPLVLTLIF